LFVNGGAEKLSAEFPRGFWAYRPSFVVVFAEYCRLVVSQQMLEEDAVAMRLTSVLDTEPRAGYDWGKLRYGRCVKWGLDGESR
jgi:hypothetical protein